MTRISHIGTLATTAAWLMLGTVVGGCVYKTVEKERTTTPVAASPPTTVVVTQQPARTVGQSSTAAATAPALASLARLLS